MIIGISMFLNFIFKVIEYCLCFFVVFLYISLYWFIERRKYISCYICFLFNLYKCFVFFVKCFVMVVFSVGFNC